MYIDEGFLALLEVGQEVDRVDGAFVMDRWYIGSR